MKKYDQELTELEDLKIELLNPFTLKLDFHGIVIHPYMRHRRSGIRMYDPLSGYKKKLVQKVKNTMTEHSIEIYSKFKSFPIKETIFVQQLPPKSLSMTNIYRLLHKDYIYSVKPDLDNIVKTTNDIINMTELIWDDDCQVRSLKVDGKFSMAGNRTIITLEYDQDYFELDKYEVDRTSYLWKQIRDYKNSKK